MIERRIAVVFVIDPLGRILMQHRSPDAAVSPNQWTMPGGKIEDGEAPIDAARREVHEETGLTVTELEPIWTGTRPSVKSTNGIVEIYAFATVTAARQDEIVLGEGQAMVFLPPEQARARDLGVTARLVLAPFLDSEAYRRIRDRAATPLPSSRRPQGTSIPASSGRPLSGDVWSQPVDARGGTGPDSTGTS